MGFEVKGMVVGVGYWDIESSGRQEGVEGGAVGIIGAVGGVKGGQEVGWWVED